MGSGRKINQCLLNCSFSSAAILPVSNSLIQQHSSPSLSASFVHISAELCHRSLSNQSFLDPN